MRTIVMAATLTAALLMSQAAIAVNKCQGQDGRIVYSDLPCRMDTHQINPPNLTNANPTSRRSGVVRPDSPASPDTTPLPPINFGPDQQTQLNRAAAIVSSILVDARSCDWDLKVTRKLDQCVTFLQQMG